MAKCSGEHGFEQSEKQKNLRKLAQSAKISGQVITELHTEFRGVFFVIFGK